MTIYGLVMESWEVTCNLKVVGTFRLDAKARSCSSPAEYALFWLFTTGSS
jgi:hypothetical protein